MKKISQSRIEWLHRHQRIADLALQRNAGMRRNLRRVIGTRKAVSNSWSVVPIPVNLLAETFEQRKKILQVMATTLKALQRPGGRVKLDFSRVQKLFPGGTLILLAYLELLLCDYRGRILARCPPKSMAAQLLSHFGIAEPLGVGSAGSKATHESVVNWQYLTGVGADGSKVSELLAKFRILAGTDLPENLYDVLAEALTNVRQHAYPNGCEIEPSLQRWWLFARYVKPLENEVGNLYIAVYDLGVGIQQTLRQRLSAGEVVLDKADELFDWAGFGNASKLDRLLLERAVDRERSSTGLPFRGKGLPEMKEFVLATKAGRLYIVSGQAQYSCIASSTASASVGFNESFPGTLILWSIPVEAKEVSK